MDRETLYLLNQLREEISSLRREVTNLKIGLEYLGKNSKAETDRLSQQMSAQFVAQYQSLAKEIKIVKEEIRK